VEYKISVQYDGTNSAYICGEWSGGTISPVSEVNGALTIQRGDYSWTLNTGDWVIAQPSPGTWFTFATESTYSVYWCEVPTS
jgi:hypothetical protein